MICPSCQKENDPSAPECWNCHIILRVDNPHPGKIIPTNIKTTGVKKEAEFPSEPSKSKEEPEAFPMAIARRRMMHLIDIAYSFSIDYDAKIHDDEELSMVFYYIMALRSATRRKKL